MEYAEQAPLGDLFNENPYEFLQNYVKNMNNELFLSQYQINNLYALLLIGRGCPWDGLRTSNTNYRGEVDVIVEKKINDVKYLLDNMSMLYEDKVKKTSFNQIQRLMSILKAKNKSIFIEKCYQDEEKVCDHEEKSDKKIQLDDRQGQEGSLQTNNIIQEPQVQKQIVEETRNGKNIENEKTQRQTLNERQSKQSNSQKAQQKLQLFGLMEGLANVSSLSLLALGNCLQYNTTQRFIKFKMSKNYIMTIKNDDPISFDLTSQVSKVPSSLFINHIFPFLTANELFKAREVCKQWFVYVKDSWHSTFKREMYIQLLAGQFCKDIDFFYKCIQLRNPFFQKLSLLLHALIQIIEWDQVTLAVQQNRVNAPFKRVLLVFLKLLGESITLNNFNDLNQDLWNLHKHKVLGLKQRVSQFFMNFSGNSMTINELRQLKVAIFDHPFMRGDEMQTQEKTPLLLLIFVKQLNLQQILKNHLHFSQEYLLNSKKRLDVISAKMPHQKGFLEGVYKILLLKAMNPKQNEELDENDKQLPNFQQMIQNIYSNKQSDEPDFYIKTKSTKTNIYMDRATKLDIIITTVKKLCGNNPLIHEQNTQDQLNVTDSQQNNRQNKQNNKQNEQDNNNNKKQSEMDDQFR